MIPIALQLKFVTIIEVINMRRCSGIANKLSFIYIFYKRAVEGYRHQGTGNQEYQNHPVFRIFL